MANLYELTSDMLQLQEMMDDPDVEVSDECLKDTFESIEGELDDKIDNYCRLIRNFEKQAALIKEEKTRLTARQASAEASAQRLKSALTRCLMQLGKEKYKTAFFSLYGFKTNKMSKYSKADVPDEYKFEKTIYEVDESRIKTALAENGGNLGWVKFIESCTIR